MRNATCFGCLVILLVLATGSQSSAESQRVFFADFNDGAPPEFSGVTTVRGVEGFAGLGPPGRQFSGNMLHNDTGGEFGPDGRLPGDRTRLTLAGLPQHTGVDLNFLLALIGSWDARTQDAIQVRLNGGIIFEKTFGTNDREYQSYQPPPGGLLTRPDSASSAAYDMSLEPLFHNLPHTYDTLELEIFAKGFNWEGGLNESWGIDNFEVVLHGVVPEPSLLTALAVAGAATLRRRRR